MAGIPELSDQPDEGGQVGGVDYVSGRAPDGQRVGREVIPFVPFFASIWARRRDREEAAEEGGRGLLVTRQ